MSDPYHGSMAPPIPVPIPVSIDGGDNAMSKQSSKYNLPFFSSTNALEEEKIDQLMQQGFTQGLARSLSRTIEAFPLRIWVVDNSGSMANIDGHRFVATKKSSDVRVVQCSRWDEIKECINYHATMAALIKAPTTFRMLNDPGVGPGSQQFGIAEDYHGPELLESQKQRALDIMSKAQPGGVTPLISHIMEIEKSVSELSPRLREEGRKVVIILATDGLPTDDRGYGGTEISNQFVHALRSLEGLPVWLVIRLCTDQDDVVHFYEHLDAELEVSVEVLDDFLGEATNIYESNPWLNYALPLHRLREMGYHERVLDMIDERSLTHDEMRQVCTLLLGGDGTVAIPDPLDDWNDFYKIIKRLLYDEKKQWNPIAKKVTPWIDLKKLDECYGDGRSCVIL